MTYPNDDDYVSFESGPEDFIQYDYDWWEEVEDTGVRSFEYHAMWGEIRDGGWEQPAGIFMLQKGRVGDESRVLGGRYFKSTRQQDEPGKAQEIGQSIYMLTVGSEYHGFEWIHAVGDESLHSPLPDEAGTQQQRSKTYSSLGEALNEARERERGKGYVDYNIF